MIQGTRTDRTPLAEWWRTIDKVTLFAVLLLMLAGIVLGLAASPAVAERSERGLFYFVVRQVVFLGPAFALLIGASMLTERQVRRAAIGVFVAAVFLTLMTIVIGDARNGATRWLSIGGLSLQPTEFLKPSFIILTAWLFAQRNKGLPVPGVAISAGMLLMVLCLLALQPDFGQAALISLVWVGLYFVAGMPVIVMALLAVIGSGASVLTYLNFPHVRERVDRFFHPVEGEIHQIDMSVAAFRSGGLTGHGPGEGVIKQYLPDAHTDFIFAVVGEEFGLIACLLLLTLFAVVVLRTLRRIRREDDHFIQLGAAGLIMIFGVQAFINMAVNVNLMPSKGMTLPFISYGGSSLLAISFSMGLVLALTRRRARIGMTGRKRLVAEFAR